MTINIAGLTVYELDVVITDCILAVIAFICARNLFRQAHDPAIRSLGTVLFVAIGSSSLIGAIFHAFFPLKTSVVSGFVVWTFVTLSIVITSAAMLSIGFKLFPVRLNTKVSHIMMMTYLILFWSYVLFIDETFPSIIMFYFPVVLALFILSTLKALTQRDPAWSFVALGLVVSILAVAIQYFNIALHPRYFNHNALYHVVQALGLILVYRGLIRARFST